MRLYVDLTYTIAVDVDPEEYDVKTLEELREAAAKDPDFPDGRLTNGPHEVYDVDWEVNTCDPAWLAPMGFVVESRRSD